MVEREAAWKGPDPLEVLRELATLSGHLVGRDALIRVKATDAARLDGHSWSVIGGALGVSAQAAYQWQERHR
jgi:hypothetical protein